MRAFLTPPIFANEDQTYSARLLHPMLLTFLVISVVFMLPLALVSPPNAGRYVLLGICFGVGGLGLLALEQRGRVRLASALLYLTRA